MPILAIGNKRWRSDAGVSLVEAMVAIMIVGLLAGAAVLLAPGPGRATQTEAERLAARIVHAQDQSVIANRTLALVLNAQGYGFEQLEETGWTPAAPSSALGFRAWPAEIEVEVENVSGIADQRVARFDALGETTQVAVVLTGSGVRWRVSVDEKGEVNVAPVE